MKVKHIPTWKLKEILNSNHITGIDGKDYYQYKEEMEQELWKREQKSTQKQIKQWEKEYIYMLENA